MANPPHHGAEAAAILKQALAGIDPEQDCVIIFKPGKEQIFYVPEAISNALREGRPVPQEVWAICALIHINDHQNDPTIQAFVRTVKAQFILDLTTKGGTAH